MNLSLWLGMFAVYVLPVVAAVVGIAWWRRSIKARKRRESVALADAAVAQREFMKASRAQRWSGSTQIGGGIYARRTPVYPPTRGVEPTRRREEESSSGINPLVAGAVGYALAGGFSHESHASPSPSYEGGGGSFGGGGSSSSWSDSSSSSSSSCDSSSSSSSDSGSSSCGSTD